MAASDWTVVNTPVAATAAVATKASAGTNGRRVCTGIHISIVATAAQPNIRFVLRDGATGAGTILASWSLAAAAGTSDRVFLGGLNIAGSLATAMTLESTTAPAATNFADATIVGRDELSA